MQKASEQLSGCSDSREACEFCWCPWGSRVIPGTLLPPFQHGDWESSSSSTSFFCFHNPLWQLPGYHSPGCNQTTRRPTWVPNPHQKEDVC